MTLTKYDAAGKVKSREEPIETEVVRVPVMRIAYPDGSTPLYLKFDMCTATANGRTYDICHAGGVVVITSSKKGEPARCWTLDVKTMLAAVIEAEGL